MIKNIRFRAIPEYKRRNQGRYKELVFKTRRTEARFSQGYSVITKSINLKIPFLPLRLTFDYKETITERRICPGCHVEYWADDEKEHNTCLKTPEQVAIWVNKINNLQRFP